MSANLDKLRRLLAELFQLDQADLDFGIYRIMNAKREEITRFLETELLPQVKEAFQHYRSADKTVVQEELDKTIEGARTAGFDPELSPKVKELREKLAAAVDVTALENEVFSDLHNFFRRYYNEGDFLSLRRYKEGVYAIPYEGEEVKLHWANADQYYIKTAEYFRNYIFKLPSGKRVHFKLAEADTERDNNQSQAGNDRRFLLSKTDPLLEQDGDLIIPFEYRPDAKGRKQKELNDQAVEKILHAPGFGDWQAELAQLRPTEKNPKRSLLEKHLTDYTARNTFDYFIHKDLGGFLRRELDFFIKNEIMHLDDIEHESAPRVEQYLSKIKVIRRIAYKIIDFLSQIENFQKKLWLKKKFVVETNYCVTLDRVPEELYPEITANDAQREEWVRLFVIDEIKGNLHTPRYSNPLTAEFLKANPYLVLDTKFFKTEFKEKLLTSFEDLDSQIDGLLIHSENFQALNLLLSRFQDQVQCIYVDPPYNTSDVGFVYKNNYKHSSWMSMMEHRLILARAFLPDGGVVQVAIDDTETNYLRIILDSIFNLSNYICSIAVEVNPAGQNIRPNSPARSHDYFHIYAKNIDCAKLLLRGLTPEEEKQYSQKDEKGYYLWDNLRRRGGNSRPTDRPNQWYPLYVDLANRKVSVDPFDGAEEVWPIDPKGEKRIWRTSPEGARADIDAGEISVLKKAGRTEVVKKSHMPEGKKPKTLWADARYSGTTHGTKLLGNYVNVTSFTYPKSLFLVQDCIQYWVGRDDIVFDFFAGSGTTGHAVINLNRHDEGQRKYMLVEMGGYFDAVLKPRIQKVVYSKDWKDGKPVSREGSSHMFKYLRLESYEDALNNLELKRTETQQSLLDQSASFKETYMLSYMLDVESRGSASLLNIDAFEDPSNYKLNIATGSAGETKPVTVDLVETFNYLLGLTVRHIDHIRGFRVVQGTNPQGEKVLVIWRNLKEKSNTDLEEFFHKQEYNPKDLEFDLIYVNGDNNLENLRRPDETWKVRLIEEEFHRLMFQVEDV